MYLELTIRAVEMAIWGKDILEELIDIIKYHLVFVLVVGLRMPNNLDITSIGTFIMGRRL